MPKNELLDLLMTSFDRYPYWSLKALRQETQQPEAYLKDVLSTIGDLHKRGPYTGNWSLKSEFRDAPREKAAPPVQASGSTQPAAATPAKSAAEDDGADDDDDDDDDGEDFDEVI
jgi:transcription initiation factor TFIIF subunit beta